jgi:hypothetical protein
MPTIDSLVTLCHPEHMTVRRVCHFEPEDGQVTKPDGLRWFKAVDAQLVLFPYPPRSDACETENRGIALLIGSADRSPSVAQRLQ